ncbi:MAG: FHA domain-containing protein [Phototrophicaceae bacterium]|jgi:hypothetical protein
MTDSPQLQSESKIECQICGFANRLGSLICINCGSVIDTTIGARQKTRSLDVEALEKAGLVKLGHVEPAAQGSAYEVGMSVQLWIQDAIHPVILMPEQLRGALIMGRRDPMMQKSPDVDLDQFGGYRMGVSRRHATLEVVNGILYLTDLDSANGTYLNNRRLLVARRGEVVVAGDQIRLGQISIKTVFVPKETP